MKIFFDVDGVLIDGFHTNPARQNRWDKTIEQDIGIRFGHIEDFIIHGVFPDVLQGRLGFEEELDRWLAQEDYDLKAWQVIEYWHKKDSNLNKDVWGAVQKLSAIKGVELYTATNQTHERIHYLRDHLGFGKCFKDFFYSARLGCLKHDPSYFANIEEELNFNPRMDSHLYFDDDKKNIEVSSARGWNAVLVDNAQDVTMHPLIQSLLG